jgi:hypothetical protein
MLFDITKLSDKFEAMTDFIPLFRFESEDSKRSEQIMYVNKNQITAFSYFKRNQKECLSVKLNYQNVGRHSIPEEYTICKEDNPVAFTELFKGVPEIFNSKYLDEE